MGTFQEDYIIAIPYSWGKNQGGAFEKLDKWIASLNQEHRSLFFKGEHLANGGTTYFMNWDGSKEGWDTSEDCNEIREKFIKKIKELFSASSIYHIRPAGGIQDEDNIIRLDHEEKVKEEPEIDKLIRLHEEGKTNSFQQDRLIELLMRQQKTK